MNADEAYELHTDVVRGLSDPGSGSRAVLDAYVANSNRTHLDAMHVFMEQHRMLAARETGQETATVQMVLGRVPDSEDEGTADEVGVEDPEAVPTGAPDEVPETVAYPNGLYIDIAVSELAKAATFYVTPDMCALLEHAARSLDDTDVMPYNPEHRSGFVILAEPIRLPYGDGTEQVVHAFGWVHYSPVLTIFETAGLAGTVFQFADRVRVPNERGVLAARNLFDSKTAWNRAPRLLVTLGDDFVVGAPVGAAVEQAKSRSLPERRREAMRNETESEPAAPVGEVEGVEVGRFQPYLAAFLLLLNQQVTAPVTREATTGAAKRGSRAGRDSAQVTVVDIRRRTSGEPGTPGEPGASGRHYHVRHLVGGHWKWQPYGPERRLRRRIFVEGYVRGPEDKPLVVKPKVYRL